MKKFIIVGVVVAVAVVSWSAVRNLNVHDEHASMGHSAVQTDIAANAVPSTRAFIEANNAMHRGMSLEFTGDADVDFAKGMIPHHEGAIAMAQIVLEHGKDAQTRALAEAIIAAQQTEIAFLRQWLSDRATQ